MITRRKVSKIRPENDETLMSFLRRVQFDANILKVEFDELVAGAPLVDDRMAERRMFNGPQLSQHVNATVAELHAMSERSLLFGIGDARQCTRSIAEVPWFGATGYGKHCPKCLRKSGHWRKSWLSPVGLVCEEHGTLLLDECFGCGAKLEDLIWNTAGPMCPACGMHLSLGPCVPAPLDVLRHSASLRSRYAMLTCNGPVCLSDRELARFGAAYRAAPWLPFYPEPLRVLQEWAQLGTFPSVVDAESAALHAAQRAILAHTIDEVWPQFSERLWLSGATSDGRRDPGQIVATGLEEFCDIAATRILAPHAIPYQSYVSFEGAPLVQAA